MKKHTKKGFTLVELLVVIAILAILASVSVVGYLGFTEKAKQSNDETLVAQLNTALQGDEAINGKPETMHDALSVVEEAGFDVEKLTPTSSKNEFLWDQSNNKFIIVPEDSLEDTTNPNYWVIVDDAGSLQSLTDNFSVYLSTEYTGTEVTVHNGFDAGEVVGIETVHYENTINSGTGKDVTVRTNGGTFEVNAPKDTVRHYGSATRLEINAVANESYHEYGSVLGNVFLDQGRFVAESDSDVYNVTITADLNANVKVENKSSKIINVSATDSDMVEKLSDIASGQVNIQETVVDLEVMHLFAGGVGTEDCPYLIRTEKELLNLANEKLVGNVYSRLVNDVVLDDQLLLNNDNTYYLDLNKFAITYSFNLVRYMEENYFGGIGGIIDLNGNTKLIIDGNGTMNFDENYMASPHSIGYTFRLEGKSSLTVKSGSIYCGLTAVQVGGSSTCTIEGGYFEAAVTWNDKYWVLNKIDGSNGNFYVKGGKYLMYDPSNSKTENPEKNFVAEGYSVVENGNFFEVVPNE